MSATDMPVRRINRNIMECKFTFLLSKFGGEIVLIETLWNVNHSGSQVIVPFSCVLIETLWNVNMRNLSG